MQFTKGLNIPRYQKIWFLFGLLSIGFRLVLPAAFIERFYSRGIFPAIRSTFDSLHSNVGIHWFWLLIAALVAVIIWHLIKLKAVDDSRKRVFRFLFGSTTLLVALAGLFLWLWGYNYGRIHFYQQLDLTPIDLEFHDIEALYKEQEAKLILLRYESASQELLEKPKAYESFIKNELESVLVNLDFEKIGNPKMKQMPPKGFLLRLGTAGFYNPFSGEVNIDDALHPLQKPFVIAHELAHAYGITDEGACNFLAVLTGRRIKHQSIRYAFELSYFRYIRSQFRRMDSKKFKSYDEQLASEIKSDLQAIYDNGQMYPDLFPKFRDSTYELFLKAQGIQEGLGSYRKVVNMIAAWDKKYKAD